jgi:cell wall-associated protease
MHNIKHIFVAVAFVSSLIATAQTKRPDNWFNLDPINDKINGVSTEKTYAELLKDKKATPTIVGVIDSGVDYLHEDLKDVMWVNPGEIAGNGIDDDKNGYIDDIHGWSFIGGKDGKNVECDNLEVTRVVKKLKPKYDAKAETDFKTKEEKKEWAYYQKAKADYDGMKTENDAGYEQFSFLYIGLHAIEEKIKSQTKNERISLEALQQFDVADKQDKQLKLIAISQIKSGRATDLTDFLEGVKEGYDHYKSFAECALSLEYDPRVIVGDNYENSSEKFYGNADCKGPDAFHGTHVAGIIAASRKNNVGMDGVAADVKIMAIRVVPNGDERDKDVANGIIYAVDNGCKIINMSFGKKYGSDKKAVDAAVKYAESKGVLLIHAAGNDNLDIDQVTHFPAKKFEGKGEATNFMDVGALSWRKHDSIVAPFSNYGKKTVDIFAPGVDIYSTIPEGKYKDASGTSMACPVTCGVAAVLKSYYPNLTPQQIKKILIKSSLKTYKGKKVLKPGSKTEMVKFEKLGKNAGVVNLYEAVKMAEKYNKLKT